VVRRLAGWAVVRVLICPDRMGPLSSATASRALAVGWPEALVRTVGESGRGFVEAVADGWASPLQTSVLDGAPVEMAATASGEVVVLGVSGGGPAEAGTPIPYDASSVVLGRAIAEALVEHRPRRLLVDLGGLDVHDAGAGLLAALGATSAGAELTGGVRGLAGLSAVDLTAARHLLAGVELIGVVPAAEREAQLLGFRGITSRRGRSVDTDAALLLSTDAALQRYTELADATADAPGAGTAGAGACGGLGWAVLAVGGRLVSGPDLCLAEAGRAYDLVVTGCGVFDFASRGGGVVAAAAELAAECLAPCIVVAGEVLIGGREMRTLGIEAAYAIRQSTLDRPTGGDLSEPELVATVTRVSRSWRW
jgi:glycerate kinase